MLTHVHFVVLAHFGAFRENEVHIFYCAGGKFGVVAGVFLAEKTLTGRWLLEHRTLRRPVQTVPGPVRVRHRMIGTGRWLERPVVRVRCAGVLRPSLRMSPVCTGRVRCQPAQRPVLCRLPLDSDTRLTLEHRTQVLSVRCPFKSVR